MRAKHFSMKPLWSEVILNGNGFKILILVNTSHLTLFSATLNSLRAMFEISLDMEAARYLILVVMPSYRAV